MSRREWKRCPVSGLPQGRVGEAFTALETGHFDPATLPDCNLYNTNTVCAAIFGPRVNVSRTLPRLLADPRFHHRVIEDVEGRRLSIATAQNSAEAYRDLWQADRRETWCANFAAAWGRPWPLRRSGGG
jgi:hypothetical protein